MNRLILIFLLVLPPLLGVAQTQDRKEDAPPPPPVNVLQGGWDNNVANSQAAQWKDANTNAPSNALMQLNWLRSEQNAMIGNNNGVLKTADKAQLDRIANDIKTTAPGSFEQHLADYFVEFPKAAAFTELETAYKLAPERTELLAPMLSKAMLDGDAAELKKWSGEMQRRGGVVPQLKAAAEDVLLSLPADGILFTNGDMDTQPAVVEQVQRNDKPGVLIVDRRLLADPGYRQRTWQQADATGSVPTAGPDFAKGLLRSGTRPVYFALSLDRNWLDAFKGQLHAVGAVFRVGPAKLNDDALLAQHWAAMKKPLDAGPLSRNYLLPGAILLHQYRSSGNEAGASLLEHELRQMAVATGATQDLYKLGILQH
ncbi:MAG: hypothetical protein IPF78_04080 [Flavobacteriales bacterium]|nr:hypothetical protein [Flavobacteriales bacterium]